MQLRFVFRNLTRFRHEHLVPILKPWITSLLIMNGVRKYRNHYVLKYNLELQGGSPRLCRLKTDRLAPMSKFELCTGAYGILWGPANWVASCAIETKAILPYLTGVKWDSAWATHGVSVEAYAWKMWIRVRWALVVSLTVLWTVATHGALLARMCRVVRLIPLQGWLLIRISAITLRYG
jgi:hypothetical protein